MQSLNIKLTAMKKVTLWFLGVGLLFGAVFHAVVSHGISALLMLLAASVLLPPTNLKWQKVQFARTFVNGFWPSLLTGAILWFLVVAFFPPLQITRVNESPRWSAPSAYVQEVFDTQGVSYQVTEAYYSEKLSNGIFQENTEGIFLSLLVEVENHTKEPVLLDNSMFVLKDSLGNLYNHSDKGGLYFETTGTPTFFWRNLNPGIAYVGIVVFEVPAKGTYFAVMPGGQSLTVN